MTDSFVAEGVNPKLAEPKLREAMYEQLWVIPNWETIQQSMDDVNRQKLEFKTGKPTGVQTKWEVGFKFFNPPTKFYLYWKLLEAQGFPDDRVTASTHRWIFQNGSPVHLVETPKSVINVGQETEASTFTLIFNTTKWVSESWINSNGEVTFKLKLVIMEPDVISKEFKAELFKKASFSQLRTNFATLIGDEATADLKIRTSDGKELLAHKAILKAQCSVFESMFRSDFSENKTGVVNVADVTAKSMGIFLHFFYSGELLTSWMDQDTVVEFTYAVGKYQLTNVLSFLDEMLGSRDEKNAFQTDIQLLNLARKLDLKTAEKELLMKIRKAMNKVNSGDEFFDLFGDSLKLNEIN